MVVSLPNSSSASNTSIDASIITTKSTIKMEKGTTSASTDLSFSPSITNNKNIQVSCSTTTASTSPPPSPTSIGSTTNTTLSTAKTNHSRKKKPDSKKVETYEVNYRSKTVTSLFISIENCNWKEASNNCTNFSSHVRTWVSSTGTDDPTSWCVWRRLPIHEACRRQPPLSFVEQLLHEFPESACEKTQFGELPIHLACGCAASSDILNLLLVYNPLGALVRDNGGRTPLDILKSSSSKPNKATSEAFIACQETLVQHNANHAYKVERHTLKHTKQLHSLNKKSLRDLKEKDDAYLLQAKKLSSYKRQISELVDTMRECEVKIMDKNKAESKLMDRIFQLEAENASIRTDNQTLKSTLRDSQADAEDKQDKIHRLSNVVQVLVSDLNTLVDEKDSLLQKSHDWETEAQLLLQKQQHMHVEMQTQREGVRSFTYKIAHGVDSILDSDDFIKQFNGSSILNDKKKIARDEKRREEREFPGVLTDLDKELLAKTAAANVVRSSSEDDDDDDYIIKEDF